METGLGLGGPVSMGAMSLSRAILTIWSVWVTFGLPVSLARRLGGAWRDPSLPREAKVGRTGMLLGIAVWCPYVGLTRLAGISVPVLPVVLVHTVLLYGGLWMMRGDQRRSR